MRGHDASVVELRDIRLGPVSADNVRPAYLLADIPMNYDSVIIGDETGTPGIKIACMWRRTWR